MHSAMTAATPSETKLLAKTVGLAQLVGQRFGNKIPANTRLRMLLSALLQVVRALGAAEKAIGMTDRYIDLISLLSHFAFPQALQLLQDSRWVVAVQRKIIMVTVKKQFVRWRVINSQRQRRHLAPELDILDDLSKQLRFKRTINRELKSAMREVTKTPLQDAFSKWRLTCRSKRVIGCAIVETAQNTLQRWRKWSMLRRIYDNYVGVGYVVQGGEHSLGEALSLGIVAMAKFVFSEWRGAAKLQRRRVSDFIHDKRGTWDAWRNARLKREDFLRLAVLYDGARCGRPSLCKWIAAHTKSSFAREQAYCHDRDRLLSSCFEVWRGRRMESMTLNRFIGRWRSAIEYRRRGLLAADNFHQRKLVVYGFQRWRTRAVVTTALKASATKIISLRTHRGVRLFLNVWREMNRWVHRNSEKVRTLRAARTARQNLEIWRGCLNMKHAADDFVRARILRVALGLWKEKLEDIRGAHVFRGDTFANWRRLVQTRQVIRQKFGLVTKGTCLTLIPLVAKAKIFRDWRRRAALVRCKLLLLTLSFRIVRWNCMKRKSANK